MQRTGSMGPRERISYLQFPNLGPFAKPNQCPDSDTEACTPGRHACQLRWAWRWTTLCPSGSLQTPTRSTTTGAAKIMVRDTGPRAEVSWLNGSNKPVVAQGGADIEISNKVRNTKDEQFGGLYRAEEEYLRRARLIEVLTPGMAGLFPATTAPPSHHTLYTSVSAPAAGCLQSPSPHQVLPQTSSTQDVEGYKTVDGLSLAIALYPSKAGFSRPSHCSAPGSRTGPCLCTVPWEHPCGATKSLTKG